MTLWSYSGLEKFRRMGQTLIFCPWALLWQALLPQSIMILLEVCVFVSFSAKGPLMRLPKPQRPPHSYSSQVSTSWDALGLKPPACADLATFLPFPVAGIHFLPSLAWTTKMASPWMPGRQEECAVFSSRLPQEL